MGANLNTPGPPAAHYGAPLAGQVALAYQDTGSVTAPSIAGAIGSAA